MKERKLIVRLKGGLGNQMFQYAAARAMAKRNEMELVVDTYSGFVRDRTYRRSFSLGKFSLSARPARTLEQGPFWFEQLIEKYVRQNDSGVKKRPWGLVLRDNGTKFHSDLLDEKYDSNLWLDGYWQSEEYFQDVAETIVKEFKLESPNDEHLSAIAKKIQQQNAVAVGIRLYEEAPSGTHDIVPLSFYEQASRKLAQNIDSPVFYLFCTVHKPIDGKLSLPGEVHYVTQPDGYRGELNILWLLSRFRYHVISNSSFYWWGAWLAEKEQPDVRVYACNLFPNRDSIPERWIRCKGDR